MPIITEIAASVAITAAPCRPTAISSDRRMMPAPLVPPTTKPHSTDGDAEPAVGQREPVPAREAAQRHAERQHAADHDHGAAPGEQGVAPGAERRGDERRRDDDPGAPPVDQVAEGEARGSCW